MSIWGRRDSEPPAEGTHEGQSPAQAQQAPGKPGAQGQAEPGPEAEEQAPAFWRAQGETPAPFARSPAGAPPLNGAAPHADAPPPARGPVPDGTPAPAGSQAAQPADDMVVLDGATAGKDPALTATALDNAGMAGAEPAPGAQEPAMPEPAGPEAVVPEAVAPGAATTEAPGPAAAGSAPPAGVPQAAADAPGSRAGISAQRWSEILAAFVDDPRGSVKMAADAVEEAIDEFVNSVWARQRALDSSWHGAGTDTEQLRTALRGYRRFWHQVQQLDLAGKNGA